MSRLQPRYDRSIELARYRPIVHRRADHNDVGRLELLENGIDNLAPGADVSAGQVIDQVFAQVPALNPSAGIRLQAADRRLGRKGGA